MSSLFDGFEEYRTVTEGDYERVLREASIVLDANIFLSLYLYNARARDDFLGILELLRERLWVPYHVIAEYWRNRERLLWAYANADSGLIGELQKHYGSISSALQGWGRRSALPGHQVNDLEAPLKRSFDALVEQVSKLTNSESLKTFQDTSEDLILQRLEGILRDRIGQAPESAALMVALKESGRRLAEGIPPAVKGSQAGGDAVSTDYLIWNQIINEAERARRDVLFVTGDLKDSWWHRQQGRILGPRRELVRELRVRAGVQLYMLPPEKFLLYASRSLHTNVDEASSGEVERVERLTADFSWRAEEYETIDSVNTRYYG